MNQSNNSRRDFLRESAMLGPGAVFAGPGGVCVEKSSGYGKGPFCCGHEYERLTVQYGIFAGRGLVKLKAILQKMNAGTVSLFM